MADLRRVKEKAAEADEAQGTGGLLTRKVEAAAKTMLAKKVPPGQKWAFQLVVDRSGSMYYMYQDGSVQNAVDTALGFAVIVDDDGEVPTCFFDDRLEEKTVHLDDFYKFVERNGIGSRNTTALHLALRWVAEQTGNADLLNGGGGGGLFRGRGGGNSPTVRPMQTPAFVTIVTDGRPDDEGKATDLIRLLSYRAVFLKFLYVGTDARGWAYLESLDDDIPVGVPYERGGRLIDNVDAKKVELLTSDEAVYDAMLDEVPSFLQAARANGLIA